jgi:hypothetical protein
MSRLSRRNRTEKEMGIKNSGGLPDLFDNAIKYAYRLTDDEYDYLLEMVEDKDDEHDLLLSEEFTFAGKRQVLAVLNKYLPTGFVVPEESTCPRYKTQS